jgi:hypothetical protein
LPKSNRLGSQRRKTEVLPTHHGKKATIEKPRRAKMITMPKQTTFCCKLYGHCTVIHSRSKQVGTEERKENIMQIRHATGKEQEVLSPGLCHKGQVKQQAPSL